VKAVWVGRSGMVFFSSLLRQNTERENLNPTR